MKRNKCRELLYQFYKDWYAWALDEELPRTKEFLEHMGLCGNLTRYLIQIKGYKQEEAEQVLVMMHDDLWNAGYPNTTIPFNHDIDEYQRESQLGVHHWNVNRLAWVEEQIALYEEEQDRRVDV